MKKTSIIFLLVVGFILAAALPGCSSAPSALNGSGKIIDQDIEITDFNSVNVSGAFILDIKQSSGYKVTLSTDDNLLSRFKIVLDRKTLKISIEAPASFFPTSLKMAIEMPQIAGLNLSGGAAAMLSGFKSAGNFSMFLAEKSKVEGNVTAGEAVFQLTGSSTAALSGLATRLDLVSTGDSKVDLADFPLISAQVKLQEHSQAIINVSGRFDVELHEESKVFFLGNPIFSNTSISGGSTMSMIQK
jgi:hypothetical protein